jgi:hypothetical protein
VCAALAGSYPDKSRLCRARGSSSDQGTFQNFPRIDVPVLICSAPHAQDIFRKYPHSYEGIIPVLCSNLDDLDEPEAKASLIWIIGEYAEKIENADELLRIFLETFKEEPVQNRFNCKPSQQLSNFS